MPKTKNAFAFRDFNEEKILQRPYFKKFNLPKKTDTEILESLQPTGDDSVDEMEQKLSTVKALHKRCINFTYLIRRHIARRIKLSGGALNYLDYPTADWAVNDLAKRLMQQYYELEEKIEKRYRQITAASLRKYIKSAGFTQKEIGDRVQISQRGFSHYVCGTNDIPTYTLIRLSKILKVSTDELLGLK